MSCYNWDALQKGWTVLDDMQLITLLDSANMIGAAQDTWQQLQHGFNIDLSLIRGSEINNIVFMGMGGSALAAALFESWQREELTIPFTYHREYDVPGWVDNSSLVIVSSYSGNTEEAVSAYEHARQKHAKLVVMDHDGELMRIARFEDLPRYEIPSALQPRMAAFYMLRALCEVIEHIGAGQNLVFQLEEASKRLKNTTIGWRKDVTTEYNFAKQLALRIMDKTAVIMGGPLMSSAAYKWKIGLNESAKNLAFYSTWPEFDHNELLGWSFKPDNKNFVIIELHSSHESDRMRQRYDATNKLLAGKVPEPIIVQCFGETAIEQLLWAVMLGDHVSVYLGIANGINPEPVALIEELKKELKSSG